MFYFFIIAVAVALSIDLFQMGSITSFFQKKITRADAFKLVGIAGTLPIIFILFGWLAGKSLISMLSEQSSWYAASVFFLLSLKSLFDGFKLKPMKKSINPIDIKGLMVLTLFVSINGFLGGLGFGLLFVPVQLLLYVPLIFIVAILAGYLSGIHIKKLFSWQSEFLFSIICLVVALLIIRNY